MPSLPHTPIEIENMLRTIGVRSTGDLFQTIPSKIQEEASLHLPEPLSELELFRHLGQIASKNQCGEETLSFLGAGVYQHFSPAAVTELAGRSEFVTPYTPYQPEISQGTLQAIFEYQSLIARIFNMDIANASLYDGSTATVEAALMALRLTPTKKTIAVAETLHPEYREVLATHLHPIGAKIVVIPSDKGCFNLAALKDLVNGDLATLIVQYPNFFGIVEDYRVAAALTHRAGGILISVTPEPVALGLIAPPGDWDADVAVGEGLSFGLAPNFGGPALGLFACRQRFLRTMPGRLCGETFDQDGKRGYVLTLSTREQHIRRERATSNICTNQTHCATTAAIWLTLLGKEGFTELAQINAAKAAYARERLTQIPGITLPFMGPAFNEFVVELPKRASAVLDGLRKQNIHGGVDLGKWYPNIKNALLVCVTELHAKEDIDRYAEALRGLA